VHGHADRVRSYELLADLARDLKPSAAPVEPPPAQALPAAAAETARQNG
jgi:hypothetical protein